MWSILIVWNSWLNIHIFIVNLSSFAYLLIKLRCIAFLLSFHDQIFGRKFSNERIARGVEPLSADDSSLGVDLTKWTMKISFYRTGNSSSWPWWRRNQLLLFWSIFSIGTRFFITVWRAHDITGNFPEEPSRHTVIRAITCLRFEFGHWDCGGSLRLQGLTCGRPQLLLEI